jgi:hypothetical protein
MHHFGRGLVRTPADFGKMGEKPTHPELLDWLADEFVTQGWSLKKLHRLIMTSTAYRQASASAAHPARRGADPDNMLYWGKPIVRLDAEALRDSVLAVSGTLNEAMFGPAVPVRPDATGQIVIGVDKTEGDNKMPVDVPLRGEEFRRSVYVQVRRSRPLAMLTTFDAPVMEINCERRTTSTVAPQALLLMNSQFILDQAARFADRLAREAGTEPEGRVRRAWALAFARPPSEQELQRSLAFLHRQIAYLQREMAPAAENASASPNEKEKEKEKKAKAAPKVEPEIQALRNLCQALLGANEFLYVD